MFQTVCKVDFGPAACQTHLSLRILTPRQVSGGAGEGDVGLFGTQVRYPGGPVAVIAGVGRERGLLRLRFSPQALRVHSSNSYVPA